MGNDSSKGDSTSSTQNIQTWPEGDGDSVQSSRTKKPEGLLSSSSSPQLVIRRAESDNNVVDFESSRDFDVSPTNNPKSLQCLCSIESNTDENRNAMDMSFQELDDVSRRETKHDNVTPVKNTYSSQAQSKGSSPSKSSQSKCVDRYDSSDNVFEFENTFSSPTNNVRPFNASGDLGNQRKIVHKKMHSDLDIQDLDESFD
jgi:hypothetical protein